MCWWNTPASIYQKLRCHLVYSVHGGISIITHDKCSCKLGRSHFWHNRIISLVQHSERQNSFGKVWGRICRHRMWRQPVFSWLCQIWTRWEGIIPQVVQGVIWIYLVQNFVVQYFHKDVKNIFQGQPFQKCVAHKMVDDNQCTILW